MSQDGNTAQQRQREIPYADSCIECGIADLDNTVSALESSLESVLNPQGDPASQTGSGEEARTPLGHSLLAHSVRIRRIEDRLQDILNRLEC